MRRGHGGSRVSTQGRSFFALVALVTTLSTVGCGPKERIDLLYPHSGDGARALFQVAFSTEVTAQENFVLRPDEYGGVCVDNRRNTIYVGSRDGRLLALDQDDGQERWSLDVGGAVSSTPWLGADGKLLVGTDDGALLRIDPETREILWRYATRGTVRRDPIVHRGIVYFVNSRDEVRAVDMRSGEHIWQHSREFQRDFTVYGKAGLAFVANDEAPQAGGRAGDRSAEQEHAQVGVLYGGFDDGRVVAIGATTGSALWITNLAPPGDDEFVDVDSTPLVDLKHQQLIVSSQATGVHALALEDGAKIWSYPVRGAGSVVKAPGDLYIFTSAMEGIFAVDGAGELRWHEKFSAGTPSTPLVVHDTTVYVTHSEVGLLAYDAQSGEFLAGIETGSGMSSVPVWDPITDRIYATSNRGMLFALQLRSSLSPGS